MTFEELRQDLILRATAAGIEVVVVPASYLVGAQPSQGRDHCEGCGINFDQDLNAVRKLKHEPS